MMEVKEKILCAAVSILKHNEEEPIIISGFRHGDCFNLMERLGLKIWKKCDQGFLTSTGRFVKRAEAKKIAKEAGQLIRESEFKNLISEDIY